MSRVREDSNQIADATLGTGDEREHKRTDPRVGNARTWRSPFKENDTARGRAAAASRCGNQSVGRRTRMPNRSRE
jgi:hypothetical protein